MLPTNTSNPNIVTGTATSGDTSNWAMKITPVAGTYAPTIENGFNSYRTIPDTYTKVATLNTNTDFTIGSSLQSTYRVFVSQAQPADTYTGKVKYTLVHPNDADPPTQPQAAEPKCISYWPNASGVVDSMANDCNSGPTGNGYGNRADATLWATNFRRDGYGFAGWSDKFDWVLNENDENGNGTGANAGYHIYGPNQEITTPSDMTEKGLSLYAIWIPAQGTLQSFTTSQCNAMNMGEVTALKDARDYNAYTVAKLKDGKCWMVENLRLDNTNSDNATGNLAQGYAKSTTYGDFIGLAEPETANFSGHTTANSIYYSGTQSGTASIDIGTSNYPASRMPRFNNQNTLFPAINMTIWGANISNLPNVYSVGNWYNWPASVADTSYDPAGTSTSICPKGWRLPQGGDKTKIEQENDNDFWNLAVVGLNNSVLPNDYSINQFYRGNEATSLSNALRGYPNNFIYSRYFGGYRGSEISSGGSGHYWASSADVTTAYSLTFHNNVVNPGFSAYGSWKHYGYSVRCLVGS